VEKGRKPFKMSKDLSKLVKKLASDNPELRKHLVPLLKEAGYKRRPEFTMEISRGGAEFGFYYPYVKTNMEEQKEKCWEEFKAIVKIIFKKYKGRKLYFNSNLSDIIVLPKEFMLHKNKKPSISVPDVFKHKSLNIEKEVKQIVNRFGWVLDIGWVAYYH